MNVTILPIKNHNNPNNRSKPSECFKCKLRRQPVYTYQSVNYT